MTRTVSIVARDRVILVISAMVMTFSLAACSQQDTLADPLYPYMQTTSESTESTQYDVVLPETSENQILATYNNAVALMEAKQYQEAIPAFEALGEYKDSKYRIAECKRAIYNDATALMEEGKYQEAIPAFKALDGYKDSEDRIYKCKINSVNVGDTFTFGSYEQDNDKSNGKEAIEWLVVGKVESRILVISKYALDCQPYNTSCGATWETCTLRKWLNNDFLNSAFSRLEQFMIPTVTVSADRNPKYYNTNPGNDTRDKVFLLSITEMNNALVKCEATAYAKMQGAEIYDDYGYERCIWWLRSSGWDQTRAAICSNSIDSYGHYVDEYNKAVRPALWIDLNYPEAMDIYDYAVLHMADKFYLEAISVFEALDGYRDSEDKISACKTAMYNTAIALMEAGKYQEAISTLEVLDGYKDSINRIEQCYIGICGEEVWNEIKNVNIGDTYIFGSYEQDNNNSNGKEKIEWLVIAKEGPKILVISKYALDCQSYNTSVTDVTWETCTLRKWLNNVFLNTAFSNEDREMIPTVTVSAHKNPEEGTNPGNDTQDKVFLLSITEVSRYFRSDSARECKATEYAKAQGVNISSYNGKSWWWLRSPGLQNTYAAFVRGDGEVYELGTGVGDYYGNDGAVRPVLWIDLSKI